MKERWWWSPEIKSGEERGSLAFYKLLFLIFKIIILFFNFI